MVEPRNEKRQIGFCFRRVLCNSTAMQLFVISVKMCTITVIYTKLLPINFPMVVSQPGV